MKKKNRILIILLLLALAGGFAGSYIFKQQSYSDETVEGISETSFENSIWQYGVLFGKNQLLFENGQIVYMALSKGIPVTLCTKPDCAHNTDDCMANLTGSDSPQVLTCYDGNLYAGTENGNKIIFYREKLDGSGHEKAAEILATDDVYDQIQSTDYYVYQNFVYIAAGVADTDDVKVLKDGTMSDSKMKMKLFCYDLTKQKLLELYEFAGEYYQWFLKFRYEDEDILYYDMQASQYPYEQIYDTETGKLLHPEYEAEDIRIAGGIDTNTGKEVTDLPYTYCDYIGNDGEKNYFVTYESDLETMTGEIRVEDPRTGGEQQINLPAIKGKTTPVVRRVENEFVVQEAASAGRNSGIIAFYNEKGEKTNTIKKSNWYVVGAYKDWYLLGNTATSSTMAAYVKKEEIKQVNKKCVRLREE